ncbi:hypothetical protein HHI36_007918, partial [Cryptolaemus montrouzieri]
KLALYKYPSFSTAESIIGLRKFLISCRGKYTAPIMVGDINIDILDQQGNAAHDYVNALHGEGSQSLMNTPTRKHRCIDHIFLKSTVPIANFTSICWKMGLTDHDSVILIMRGTDNDFPIRIHPKNSKIFY